MSKVHICIEKVLKNFSVGGLRDFELIQNGVSSKNWKVETSEGYFFLKKHSVLGAKRIDSIEKVENFFSSHGIPIVLPVETKEGGFHVVYKGDMYVLYPFIVGRNVEIGKLSEKISANMGEMLARIHLLTKEGIREVYADVSTYFTPRLPEEQIEEINRFLSKIPQGRSKTEYDYVAEEGLRLKKNMVLRYATEIRQLSSEKFNLGHGDYHPLNVFFTEDGDISAIFDLDMAGPMPRVYELVRSIMISCFERGYAEERFSQAVAFVRAYFKKYPFKKEDFRKAMRRYFFKTLSVWREQAHYEEGDFRTDAKYPLSLGNITYLEAHWEELIERLYSSLDGI